MGGSNGTLAITLDSEFVHPGDDVNGRVFLDVKKDKVDASSLMLRLIGAEYTQVRWTTTHKDSEGRTHTTRHTANSHCVFLDMDFALSSVPQGFFAKGQYEFPFRMTLPTGVHPTMFCSIPGDHGGYAHVRYNLEARLHRPGWFKWDVHTSREVKTLGPRSDQLTQCLAYVNPTKEEVYACCCWHRGSIALGGHTERGVLAAGENFAINFAIENNSHATIKAVEIYVNETVSWKAAGYAKAKLIVLFKQRFELNELKNVDLTPLKKRLPKGTEVTFPDEMTILRAIKDALDSGKNVCNAQISPEARVTFSGRLITVRHDLIIKCCTTFGTNNPTIIHPLTLHRNGISIVSAESAADGGVPEATVVNPIQEVPPGWNPVRAEPVFLPVPAFIQPVMGNDGAPPPPAEYAPQTIQSVEGFTNLIALLNNTYDQMYEFRRWIKANDANGLTPFNFAELFKTMRSMLDQVRVAELLAENRASVTCEHISQAMLACQEVMRPDIVSRLAPKCSDKENSAVIKKGLTPFAYLVVEHYFESPSAPPSTATTPSVSEKADEPVAVEAV